MLERSKCTFEISLHLNFGESLYLYGQEDELGKWKTGDALIMEWSEGDLWSLCVNIPVEGARRIEYGYFAARSDNPNEITRMEKGYCRAALIKQGENLIADKWDHLFVNLTIRLPQAFQNFQEMNFMVKTKEFSNWYPALPMQMQSNNNGITCSKLFPISKAFKKVYICFFVRTKETNEFDRDGDVRIDLAGFFEKKSAFNKGNEYLNLDLNVVRFQKVFKNEFSTYRFNHNIIFGPMPIKQEEWQLIKQECEYLVIFINAKNMKKVQNIISHENETGNQKAIKIPIEKQATQFFKEPLRPEKELTVITFCHLENQKKSILKSKFCSKLNALLDSSKRDCIFIVWDSRRNFIFKSMIEYLRTERKTNISKAEKIIRDYTMLESLRDDRDDAE